MKLLTIFLSTFVTMYLVAETSAPAKVREELSVFSASLAAGDGPIMGAYFSPNKSLLEPT